MTETYTGDQSTRSLIKELCQKLEQTTKASEKLSERMETLSNRLTRTETQIEERQNRCVSHSKKLDAHDTRIENVEKGLSELTGSWKTYLVVGGISGIVGALITKIT